MKNTRAVWADTLRILSMFFVVFIHVSPMPQNLTPVTLLYFINFAVSKTCIGLFFMLSGALLLGKEETYTTFFKKRIIKVVFPWIIWTVIYMGVQVFIQCKKIQTIPEWKYFFEVTLFTKFWIIPVLAGLYLLTPLLRKLLKHTNIKDNYYLLLLWGIFISLLPTLHDGQTFPLSFPPGIFSQIMMCSGFFIGGYVLTRHTPKKMTPLKSSILIVCGIILTILLALTHPTAIEGFAYNIFAPGMVMTTAGIFLLFQSLSDSFETISSRAKLVLQMISTASFGVYLTHELINQFVRYILILIHQTLLLNTDLLTDYLRALIIFSLATLVTYAIQQLPLLKKIVP